MTNATSFYQKPCSQMDAKCVNASFNLKLDELNPSKLILENSWEDTSVDLEAAVKDAETVTHMLLSPDSTPIYLEHVNEDGERECIHGDDLSRIISMTKLKDVDQATDISDGDTYIYDGDTELFIPYDLAALEQRVTNLETRMTAVEAAITTIQQQIAYILQILTPPSPIPDNSRIVWGNINVYSDHTNTGLKTSGLYTHGTNIEQNNDEQFS